METEKPDRTSAEADRDAQANEIVKKYAVGAAGVGLIPVPLIDLIGLSGLQMSMARRLGQLYEIPFTDSAVRSLIVTLVGFGTSASLRPILSSLIKTVPLVGQYAGASSGAVLGGATTWAVGKVFIQHFGSGGTFLGLNPEAVRDYYAEQFEVGKNLQAEPEVERRLP